MSVQDELLLLTFVLHGIDSIFDVDECIKDNAKSSSFKTNFINRLIILIILTEERNDKTFISYLLTCLQKGKIDYL
jgi:hypothetical protein